MAQIAFRRFSVISCVAAGCRRRASEGVCGGGGQPEALLAFEGPKGDGARLRAGRLDTHPCKTCARSPPSPRRSGRKRSPARCRSRSAGGGSPAGRRRAAAPSPAQTPARPPPPRCRRSVEACRPTPQGRLARAVPPPAAARATVLSSCYSAASAAAHWTQTPPGPPSGAAPTPASGRIGVAAQVRAGRRPGTGAAALKQPGRESRPPLPRQRPPGCAARRP